MTPFDFGHEPGIPFHTTAQNLWCKSRGDLRQVPGNTKFSDIRWTDSLEPNGLPVRGKANKTESRTTIDLTELACQMQTRRLNYVTYPTGDCFEPANDFEGG